jgi:hypothetical protein
MKTLSTYAWIKIKLVHNQCTKKLNKNHFLKLFPKSRGIEEVSSTLTRRLEQQWQQGGKRILDQVKSLGSEARANMLKRSRVKNKKIETETKIIASLS